MHALLIIVQENDNQQIMKFISTYMYFKKGCIWEIP